MNKKDSDYSTNGSRKGKDNKNPYEKLINDSDEYQESDTPAKMLSKEKTPHQASEHSVFHLDDQDGSERTSAGKRKNVKRQIVISVGLLALLLIAIRGFTLLYVSLVEKKNVTSSTDLTITEVPPVQDNTSATEFHGTDSNYRLAAEHGDAEAQFHLGFIQMKKLSNGTEEQQNKAMEMANMIWDGCMRMAKACLNRMKKLLNGIENQQIKKIHTRRMPLELCIMKEKAYFNQMKKPLNGSEKQQNKGMQKGNSTLD
uniref:Uncharacterized protein n=1 Tax=Plectus sambesii TaxID=2011161 RepID=A0A914UT43_9BILA